MAELFVKQAENYAAARPTYPPELFEFIASKTASHDLVWDAGTGSGQAARSLAKIYKSVVATDTSVKLLEFADQHPNVRYAQTSPVMSATEVEERVASEGTVDLVTIAQALHWFHLPTFYQHVNHVCKKPDGVIAAWCYTVPEVSESVDSISHRFFFVDLKPYWDPARKLVDEAYRNIEFPFEPLNGESHTGPFEFASTRMMDLEEFVTYLKSGSAYQTAKDTGVELLGDGVMQELRRAWNEDGNGRKLVKFPVHLRIGKVGNV